MLIGCGADVTALNKDGETPLHLAFQEGRGDVARMFIACGADVTAQNRYGLTPFQLASRGGLAEVTRALLEHGADPVPMISGKPYMVKPALGNQMMQKCRNKVEKYCNLLIVGSLGILLSIVVVYFKFLRHTLYDVL
jgi:ankyrin repeat protein